jgi:uncharacterized protein
MARVARTMSRVTKPEQGGPLSLLDWRRTINELYAEIRSIPNKHAAWQRWCEVRAHLFRTHPQSPVPASERDDYSGPYLFDYDPELRVSATVEAVDSRRFELTTSNVEVMAFSRFGIAHFELAAAELALELYWLEGYGGGLFLPFADATSGRTTYGAGRYLIDTVKGADLGTVDGRLVLDFNFAYNPSCVYDPRWTCPLAPAANRLAVEMRAGERVLG